MYPDSIADSSALISNELNCSTNSPNHSPGGDATVLLEMGSASFEICGTEPVKEIEQEVMDAEATVEELADTQEDIDESSLSSVPAEIEQNESVNCDKISFATEQTNDDPVEEDPVDNASDHASILQEDRLAEALLKDQDDFSTTPSQATTVIGTDESSYMDHSSVCLPESCDSSFDPNQLPSNVAVVSLGSEMDSASFAICGTEPAAEIGLVEELVTTEAGSLPEQANADNVVAEKGTDRVSDHEPIAQGNEEDFSVAALSKDEDSFSTTPSQVTTVIMTDESMDHSSARPSNSGLTDCR